MAELCVCVCVLPSSKSLTVLHIVPHRQDLCLQFFHLVTLFILHLDQRGREPIPTLHADLVHSAHTYTNTEFSVSVSLHQGTLHEITALLSFRHLQAASSQLFFFSSSHSQPRSSSVVKFSRKHRAVKGV